MFQIDTGLLRFVHATTLLAVRHLEFVSEWP